MAVDRFPIEEGHIATFARAIGATAAVHFGPDALAPPTFAMAAAQWDPEYPLRPVPGEPWMGSGRLPSGTADPTGPSDAGAPQLHAEQHFEYVRPVRAGDVLSATERAGRTWEKNGRSGTLHFTEWVTDYRDADGDVVVTARLVSVRTQNPVEA